MVPENSPLDSVVFRSSLQILLGVVYVIIFYVVAALVRVLTGRTALTDPTAPTEDEIAYRRSDIYEYHADEDVVSLSDGLDPYEDYDMHTSMKSIQRPRASSATETVDENGLIKRVSQDVGRRVRKIASVVTGLTVVPIGGHHEVKCADDHSPARTRRGSIDDVVLSEGSENSHLNSIAGVSSMIKPSCKEVTVEIPNKEGTDHATSKGIKPMEDIL